MAKKLQSRRRRFLDRANWHRSKSNPDNVWRWVDLPNDERERLVVYLREDTWGSEYYGIYLHDVQHWDKYETQEQAMEAAFDVLEELTAEAY